MYLFIIVLNISIISNHILMAMILWFRKSNTSANKVLGLILVLPVFAFVTNLLVYLDEIYRVFILYYLSAATGLLFGPSLLYYFNLMAGKKIKLTWKHLIHLLPALITSIISLQLIFISHEEKMVLMARVKAGTDDITNILNLALLLHILYYLFLSWRMQKNYGQEVKSFFTDFEHTRYLWIRKFIRVLVLLNVSLISSYIAPAIFAPELTIYADLIAAPFLSTLIYLFVLVAGFSNHAIFTNVQYSNYVKELIPFNEYLQETNDSKKYGASALKEEEIKDIQSKLVSLLDTQKPYLDKELSINKLADSIGISSHQLSQFINRTYDKKFYDFINYYRVEEAKKLLTDSSLDYYKIEAIGEASGFNSRATFFTVFKKLTGITPHAYKKTIQIDIQVFTN